MRMAEARAAGLGGNFAGRVWCVWGERLVMRVSKNAFKVRGAPASVLCMVRGQRVDEHSHVLRITT
jgi:hypothetical protein